MIKTSYRYDEYLSSRILTKSSAIQHQKRVIFGNAKRTTTNDLGAEHAAAPKAHQLPEIVS
jgi:hypothetical protein